MGAFDEHPYTLTIVGCGELGRAIITGLLSDHSLGADLATYPQGMLPAPSKILACVRSISSADHLRKKFTSPLVSVVHTSCIAAVEDADIVLLATKASDAPKLLHDPRFRSAVSEKLFLNACVKFPNTHLLNALRDGTGQPHTSSLFHVIQTVPNPACSVRQSITFIENTMSLPADLQRLAEQFWCSLGTVIYVDEDLVDSAAIVCGSPTGFLAAFADGLIQGAVNEGFRRDTAQQMIAQAMEGTARMMRLGNQTPKSIVSSAATPGGCTAAGLEVMKRENVEGAAVEAMEKSIAQTRQ